MGERKGQNKYYPPDYDPKKGGLNKFLGTHALRERAKKLHLGILIVRIEMPFNVWCEGCGNHIGMGVRYNAEKKKVGMYYTTPIYQFRMKCHLCQTQFEIKTDPKNFEYEVISGLRRQELRYQAADTEVVECVDKATVQKLATDAMFKLEHGENDIASKKITQPHLQRLQAMQDRWEDDFTQNQLLRKLARTKKKAQKAVDEANRAVQTKYALDIPLVDEDEDDKRVASLMAEYRTVESSEQKQARKREAIVNQPLFASVKRARQSTATDASSSSFSTPSTSATGLRTLSKANDLRREQRLQSRIVREHLQTSRLQVKIERLDSQLAATSSKQLVVVGAKASSRGAVPNGSSARECALGAGPSATVKRAAADDGECGASSSEAPAPTPASPPRKFELKTDSWSDDELSDSGAVRRSDTSGGLAALTAYAPTSGSDSD